MNQVLRWSAAIFLFVLTTWLGITSDIAADALGYRDFLTKWFQDGWVAMDETGYLTWILGGAIFFAGATGALWLDYWLRKFLPGRNSKLETTHDLQFHGGEVFIDGKDFRNCIFTDCTLVYAGGDVRFFKCGVRNCQLKADGDNLQKFIGLAKAAGYTDNGILIEPRSGDMKSWSYNLVGKIAPPKLVDKTKPRVTKFRSGY